MKPIVDSSPDVYTELDRRADAGLDVALLWSRGTGSLIVAVKDTSTGERFELKVAGEDALEVFNHPFAHAARRGTGWCVESQR